MKKMLFALFCFLFFANANAQFSISGKILDKSGNPLPGATVLVGESAAGVVATADGKYTLLLPGGTYTLYVSYVGFQSQTRQIVLDKNWEVDFILEEAENMTDEIVVAAFRAGSSTPATFVNLHKEQLQKNNLGQDVPYLLASTPSLVCSSDGGTGIGYSSFRIRGTDLNRINVTLNGFPVNDAESHAVYWVDLPDVASSVNQLQVQRGVGTSVNGAGAFGASINMYTLGLNSLPTTQISGSAGSFNTFKTTLTASTGLLNKHFVFDARLSRIYSDGFVDRSASDLKSFYVSAGYHAKKAIVKINYFSGFEKTGQAWNGVPKCKLENDTIAMRILAEDDGWSASETENLRKSDARTFNRYLFKNQTDNYQQNNLQGIASFLLPSRLNLNTGLHYTKGRGYYESYRYNRKFSKYMLPSALIGGDTLKSGDVIDRKWLDNDFFGFIASLVYKAQSSEWNFGGGLNRYVGYHFGKVIWSQFNSGNVPENYEWYRNKGVKTDGNVYLKMNYQLSERINMYADLQFRSIRYTVDGFDDKTDYDGNLRKLDHDLDYRFFNPKAGLFFQINPLQKAYFAVGRAHREPNRDNIVDANPDKLLPVFEKLTDYEWGYTLGFKDQQISLNVFYMDYENQLVLTGAINDVGSPVMTNVPVSYRTGLEMLVHLRYQKRISWTGSLTLARNKIEEFSQYVDNWDTWGQDSVLHKDSDLAFSPAIVVNSNFQMELFKGFQVELVSNYVGDQFIDNTANSQRKLDAYLVNNLRFGYSPKLKGVQNISFSLLINNILDHHYESNAWVYLYSVNGQQRQMDGYFPQAGRHFLVGISVQF